MRFRKRCATIALLLATPPSCTARPGPAPAAVTPVATLTPASTASTPAASPAATPAVTPWTPWFETRSESDVQADLERAIAEDARRKAVPAAPGGVSGAECLELETHRQALPLCRAPDCSTLESVQQLTVDGGFFHRCVAIASRSWYECARETKTFRQWLDCEWVLRPPFSDPLLDDEEVLVLDLAAHSVTKGSILTVALDASGRATLGVRSLETGRAEELPIEKGTKVKLGVYEYEVGFLALDSKPQRLVMKRVRR